MNTISPSARSIGIAALLVDSSPAASGAPAKDRIEQWAAHSGPRRARLPA